MALPFPTNVDESNLQFVSNYANDTFSVFYSQTVLSMSVPGGDDDPSNNSKFSESDPSFGKKRPKFFKLLTEQSINKPLLFISDLLSDLNLDWFQEGKDLC